MLLTTHNTLHVLLLTGDDQLGFVLAMEGVDSSIADREIPASYALNIEAACSRYTHEFLHASTQIELLKESFYRISITCYALYALVKPCFFHLGPFNLNSGNVQYNLQLVCLLRRKVAVFCFASKQTHWPIFVDSTQY